MNLGASISTLRQTLRGSCNNLHSHSQPILSYLRLLGIEPTADGTLQVGGGASFESPTFSLGDDGHGWLESRGEVHVTSEHGNVSGAAGRLEW